MAVRLFVFLFLLCLPLPGFSPQESARQEEDQAGRSEWFYSQRAYPFAKIPAGARLKAFQQMRRMPLVRSAGLPGGQWTSLGPAPIGTGTNSYAGRISAIAVDPRNRDVVYAGVSEGGVWKSTNGGKNWVPLGDDQPSLSIGSLALDPSNPDVLYVGTGEQNNSADSYYGAGILKLSGGNWTQIPGPFASPTGGAHLGSLVISPANPAVILAGSSGYVAGIFRSGDGGATWTQVLAGAAGSDLLFDPADANTVYAALGSNAVNASNGVYKSTDAGLTWVRLTGSGANLLPASNVGRVSLAISKSNPQLLLASIANYSDKNLLGLYQTSDGGKNWSKLGRTPNFCDQICWYANTIAINPKNPDVFYAGGGGSGAYISLDAGNNWSPIGSGTLHVDHHALVFSADGSRLYNGNDGGIWSTDQTTGVPSVWNNLNATLVTALFNHGFRQHPTDPASIFAGTQDNQLLRYSGNPAWQNLSPCGDGGRVALDPGAPNNPVVNCYNVQLYKALDLSRSTWIPVIHGIPQSELTQFYPPVLSDPTHGLRMYFGGRYVYQSLDGGGLWRAISPDLGAPGQTTAITALAVAPSDPNRVYAGTSAGTVWVTRNALDGVRAVWTQTKASLPARVLTDIAVNLSNPDEVYLAYSGFATGHIYKTADGGNSFTNISSNLPDLPVNELALDPDVPGAIYLATDLGVMGSSDDGQSWGKLGDGLPNAVAISISLHRPSRMLRVATHGRGMWELPVPALSWAPVISSISGAGPQVTLTGKSFTSETQVLWNGLPRATTYISDTQVAVEPLPDDLSSTGRATLIAANPEAAGGLSNAVNLDVGPAPVIRSIPTLSPGGLFTVYGENLASMTAQAVSGSLPVTLGGTILKIGGVTVPLSYVSAGQVNAQAPWSLFGSAVTAEVIVGNLSSGVMTVTTATAAPVIYTLSATGQGAVVDALSGAIAAPAGTFPGSVPVKAGGYISIYCTGLGPVNSAQATGAPAGSAVLASVFSPVTVTIAGLATKPLFAGLAPGFVGLYQVNVQVPAATGPSPNVPLGLTVNNIASNPVTFAVQ